jgi:hypothetical protein
VSGHAIALKHEPLILVPTLNNMIQGLMETPAPSLSAFFRAAVLTRTYVALEIAALRQHDPSPHGLAHRQTTGDPVAACRSRRVSILRGTVEAMPTYVYFLCDPPLGNLTGEYPINPAGACTDMANLFFERQLGVLAPATRSPTSSTCGVDTATVVRN